MWSSVAAVLGTIALSGCQPSLETAVSVTQLDAGRYEVALETPSWTEMSDQEIASMVDRDRPLVNQHAASLCGDSYRAEIEERRLSQCDWNCSDSRPGFFSSTIWKISCEQAET